jgi:hypothetical protein
MLLRAMLNSFALEGFTIIYLPKMLRLLFAGIIKLLVLNRSMHRVHVRRGTNMGEPNKYSDAIMLVCTSNGHEQINRPFTEKIPPAVSNAAQRGRCSLEMFSYKLTAVDDIARIDNCHYMHAVASAAYLHHSRIADILV